MSGSLFSGMWVFDPNSSQMSAPPPLAWVQRVHQEGNRLKIQEEITRASGVTTVVVDAVIDGAFYPVGGSPLADEISYTWDGPALLGVGRKDGTVFLRETIMLPEPDQMTMSILLLMNGNEVQLGTAHFRRKE